MRGNCGWTRTRLWGRSTGFSHLVAMSLNFGGGRGVVVVFSHSVVSDSFAAHQASLSFNISQSLLKLMSVESVMPSNHLVLCCPLLFLPSIFPRIRVFSNESVLCIGWPKYWNFGFSTSLSHTRRQPSLSPNVFITSLSSLAPSFSSLLDLSKPDAREGEEQ